MTNRIIQSLTNGLAVLKKRIRSWVFPEISSIDIYEGVLDNITVMARKSHPREFIAFFSGKKEPAGKGRVRLVIDEIILQHYESNNNSTYFSTINIPTTTNMVGTVHSHPGPSNRPSRADLRTFNKYGFIHAIIKYPYRKSDIAFYNKYGERLRVRIINDQDHN